MSTGLAVDLTNKRPTQSTDAGRDQSADKAVDRNVDTLSHTGNVLRCRNRFSLVCFPNKIRSRLHISGSQTCSYLFVLTVQAEPSLEGSRPMFEFELIF